MNKRYIPGLLSSLLIAHAGSVMAQGASTEGDAVAGRLAAETCLGCHAVEGYFNVYPSYQVPKLGGQQAGYIASALKGYKDGSRKHNTMHANAVNLSDEAIADIAAYFASQGK
jgi:cytochrome c553